MNTTIEVFFQLLESQGLQNRELADKLGIEVRSAQRSVKRIKEAFEQSLILNKYFEFKKTGYKYSVNQRFLLNEEQILLLSKVLIASRVLNVKESSELIDKMISMVDFDKRGIISSAIASESITKTHIDDDSARQHKLWRLEQYISNKEKISFEYTDYEAKEKAETRLVELLPVHTFFDNYYLFLIGFERGSNSYKTFRLDWMKNIEKINVKIRYEYSSRPNFGKDVQHNAYGYQGKKTRIRFEYYGYIGYIKDRFPSCKVIKPLKRKNRFPFSVNLLEIDVNYSDGVKLWLLGETTILKVVEPKYIADDIKNTLYQTYKLYEEDKK